MSIGLIIQGPQGRLPDYFANGDGTHKSSPYDED